MTKASTTRRWPDILIGVLVLLLLAGFAALLLGQRKPASAAVTPEPTATAVPGVQTAPDSAQTPAAVPQDSATTPITPPAAPDTTATPDSTAPDTTATPDTTAAPTTSETTEAPIIPAVPTEPATDPAADPAATVPRTTPDTATTPEVPAALPPTSAPPAGQTADGQTPINQAAADPTPQAQVTETPADPVPAATTTAPRSGGAVATSESRTPLRSDYRISLGTFGSVGTAQSRTAPVSSLGYTVYPIDLGSQVVAQVGPFADEASARQALGDIQRAFPGALLYPPRNRPSSAPASAQSDDAPARGAASPAQASSAPAAASSSPVAATPDAPSGPIYLQVGAFDRVESAQKMVQQLRDLGYVPTVNAPEGRKVTVAVGPYTGDALTRTEQRLDNNDLDHFRVR